MFSPRQLWTSLPDAFRKLNPKHQLGNPVMFVVWVGSALTTVFAITDPSVFTILIAVWLWFTVLFANLAEAVAEGRGKAQAESLRKSKKETVARRLTATGEEQVPGVELKIGDLVVVEAGQVIPGDGDVVEGIATVDESAITGESAPVIRESGGDRSAVTGGTTVLSDRVVVKITTKPGESFVDRMIALVEGASRQKTPNEIALTILLSTLTIIFLLAVVALQPMAALLRQRAVRDRADRAAGLPDPDDDRRVAERHRHRGHGPAGAAQRPRDVRPRGRGRGRRLDVAARQDRHHHLRQSPRDRADPRGYVHDGRTRARRPAGQPRRRDPRGTQRRRADRGPRGRDERGEFVPFTAQTRMSGLDVGGRRIRKGAASAVRAWVRDNGGEFPDETERVVDEISAQGGTPLVVAEDTVVRGVIRLSDVVKPGMKERFKELRAMGIKTVMITGDNPLTAKAIAADAGVDDYLAEAKPEDKMALIKQEQEGGRLVAMTGDGTNDAPALAQSDVGVAMNTGTSAAKEAGNMVDLDSDPTKLIEIVEIGKQLLITRGALTTFSVANDLAKYFAILPAMFTGIFAQLGALNIMHLATPKSAILSAVIFNALIIVVLIPLALRGVRYKPSSASALLRRNLLVYGLGGIVSPFLGIWLIDLLVRLIPGIG